MGITVLISLYTTRVILNTLGASDFGIFNVVGGAIAMLMFLNASMAAATQRFMSFAHGQGDPEQQKRIFNVSLVLHAGIAVAVVLLLEGGGVVLFHGVLNIPPEREHAAWWIYQYAAVSTFFMILAVPYEAVITARENMLVFAILGILEAVLKLVVALLIVHVVGDKLTFYGFWMAAITALLLVLRALYCHARYTECAVAPRQYCRRPLFLEMTGFAGWSLLGSASGMLAHYGQGIVLNAFFGAIVNAAQGVASQVSGYVGACSVTLLKAVSPAITKFEGCGDRQSMLRSSMLGGKAAFLLLAVFDVPILIETRYILEIWLKNPPDYAVIFCRLFLGRFLLEQLFITLGNSIAAVGAIRRFQIANSVLNLLPLIISIGLFCAGLEPWTSYLAFMLNTLLQAWLLLHSAKKICGLEPTIYLRSVVFRSIGVFIVSCLGGVVPFLLLPSGPIRLGAVFLSSITGFGWAVWSIALDQAERIRLISVARSIVSRLGARFV